MDGMLRRCVRYVGLAAANVGLPCEELDHDLVSVVCATTTHLRASSTMAAACGCRAQTAAIAFSCRVACRGFAPPIADHGTAWRVGGWRCPLPRGLLTS